MYGKTNKIPAKLDSLNSKLEALKEQQTFVNAQAVIDEIVALFSVNSVGSWSLINDSRGKIKANASWFELAEGFADRRAAYKLAENNDKNIDFKTFWVQKPSKSIVSWIVALTPNFEDEPYNVNKNVGIDFIIPKKSDRVIIALSNNYIIRTLELDGSLTPTQQNILIKWTQPFDFANKSQLHQILWDSFDLEPVNKEFYKEISSYFVELKQHLAGLDLFDEKHAAYFSSRLIGRLIFCWFIDKKGFINPEMQYFDVYQDSTNYYHNKLEKLFFATLNTPLEERGIKFESVQSNLFSSHERENNLFNIGVDMVTPFLNGGLFEERDTDFVGNKNLTFPTDYFHRLIQTLNHYNFTTDESTSSFQQVAIDPEMLGRIFENLLAEQSEETGEQARKAKGAFYTPREIVDYMCRESLREYLKTKIPYDEMRDSKLELLLDKKSHEYRDQQKNFRQYLKNYKSDIIDALDDLKVLDPACGSGAFPMGMLQLLVQVYERLEPRFDQYETKVSIVKNNIYGVDIEPMAVEISRLRTWLSIIVDEEVDSNKVKPLPNLDFKFVCANSLIPLDQNGAQGLLDDSDLEEKLVEIREKYFNARTHNSKRNLKDKLNKLIGYSSNGKQLSGFKSNRQLQLESYQPFNPENSTEFFDSLFMFGQEKFNILVGNPPYVDSETMTRIDKNAREKYKNLYSTAKGNWDLFIPFIEKAINELLPDGIISFIIPNKLIAAKYANEVREYLSNRQIIELRDYSRQDVFTSADVYPITLLCKNSSQTNEETTLFTVMRSVSDIQSEKTIQSKSIKNYQYWDLFFYDDKQYQLLNKLLTFNRIKDIDVEILGAATVGEAYKLKEIIHQDEPADEYFKMVNTGTIDRYQSLWGKLPMQYLKDKYSYPYIIKKELNEINTTRTLQAGSNKIVVAGMTKRIEAIWDCGEYLAGKSTIIILGEDKFLKPLLGILNSKLVYYFVSRYFHSLKMSGGFLNINKDILNLIPVPSDILNKDLIRMVNDLIANYTSSTDEMLDKLVYNLFSLNEDEIGIIEDFYKNEAN